MSTTMTAQTTTTTVSMMSNNNQAGGVQDPSTTRGADGNVDFENKNYSVKVGDTGEINITNKQTGESYKVWGDPHVDVDGKHAFDFKGTTTLDLDDGTKITIDTTPWKGQNGATIASKVTIVDGQSDYAVQINGVDDNKTGDLTFNETSKGWLMDAMVDDGNTLHENPAGTGFVAMDDRGNPQKVDQKWIDKTDLMANPKSADDTKLNADMDKLVNQFAKLINIFTGIVAIRFLGQMLSGMGGDTKAHAQPHSHNHAQPRHNTRDDFSFSASQTTTSVTWKNDDNVATAKNRNFDFTMSRRSALA